MGYYSTMEGPMMFRTHCARAQEVKRIFEENFFGQIEGLEKIEDMGYELVHKKENGVSMIYIESDCYNQKHHFDEAFAWFISKLIAPKDRTYLIFTGEDNCRWGYAIASDQVEDIEIAYIVNGQFMDDWLAIKNI